MQWSAEIISAIISGLFGLVGAVLGIYNARRANNLATQLANQQAANNRELEGYKDTLMRTTQEQLNAIQAINQAKLQKLEQQLGELSEYLKARQNALEYILKCAKDAEEAAKSLVRAGGSPRDTNAVIRSFANSLQSIATFFSASNDFTKTRYLQKPETEQVERVAQILSKLFLSLDMDTEDEEQIRLQKATLEELSQAVKALSDLFLPTFQQPSLESFS